MERFQDRVILEQRGHVALILLDRPDRLNAFDEPMYEGVNEALTHVRDDDNLWAVVISSTSPKAFSAGVDLDALKANAEAGIMTGVGSLVIDGEMFTDKPIVAAVEGHCLGEAINLILSCDLVFAGETARLAIPEIRIGTNPIDIPIKLAKKMSYGAAFSFLNPGTPKDAAWCKQVGLVEEVTPKGGAEEAALAFAERLCTDCAPLAFRAQKETLWRSFFDVEESARAQGLEARQQMRRSADYQEGLKANREKRAPKFKGV